MAEQAIRQIDDVVRREAAFKDELRRRIASFRESRPVPDLIRLSDAHLLLADDEIEQALISYALEMCYALKLAYPPRERSGEFLIPYIEGDVRVLEHLHRTVVRALVDGRLIGKGFDASKIASGRAVTIARDKWRILAPDFEQSACGLNGQSVFVGVEIASAPSPKAILPKAGPAALKRWFKNEYAPNCKKQPSREDNEKAARAKFPGGFDRRQLRDLRKEVGWSAPGRKSAK